jgi:hypothetical protein
METRNPRFPHTEHPWRVPKLAELLGIPGRDLVPTEALDQLATGSDCGLIGGFHCPFEEVILG